MCVVNKQLWHAQQALNAQCYKCQVMGVLACKCVHVREISVRLTPTGLIIIYNNK